MEFCPVCHMNFSKLAFGYMMKVTGNRGEIQNVETTFSRKHLQVPINILTSLVHHQMWLYCHWCLLNSFLLSLRRVWTLCFQLLHRLSWLIRSVWTELHCLCRSSCLLVLLLPLVSVTTHWLETLLLSEESYRHILDMNVHAVMSLGVLEYNP